MARAVGLLAERSWIPQVRCPASGASQAAARPAQRRPDGRPGTVAAAGAPPVSRDQAALDALLDKISDSGMDSLTDGEREQLMILRDRLRRR